MCKKSSNRAVTTPVMFKLLSIVDQRKQIHKLVLKAKNALDQAEIDQTESACKIAFLLNAEHSSLTRYAESKPEDDYKWFLRMF